MKQFIVITKTMLIHNISPIIFISNALCIVLWKKAIRFVCKARYVAMAGVAQWIEHWPAKQKVASSIPVMTCAWV